MTGDGAAAMVGGGGALKVGWRFCSAREGGTLTVCGALPAGSSPVKDGHNESVAKEHPESKIAAPRTAPVDLRKFTLPDRQTQKTI
jgi:hypothetical protein|tara:strand:+ start:406 stop:663 length:258 start_codon:yes stop_codon:yes gene_type:complete